jgi:hypothetical protein
MSDDQDKRWSPADNPYAIAVSQSQWALWSAQLFARDAKENGGNERSQIYARQIFGQLRTLQRCAEMMVRELKRLAVDKAHRDLLLSDTVVGDGGVVGRGDRGVVNEETN